MEAAITSDEIFLCLLYIFGCFSLYQSATLFSARMNAKLFFEYIQRLVTSGDVSRAIKLSSVSPRSPVARVVKVILTQSNKTRLRSPEEVSQLCKDTFQQEAHLFSTRFGIPWLDAVAYSVGVGIFWVFCHADISYVPHTILLAPPLFALAMYTIYLGIMKDLSTHAETMARLMPSMPVSPEPYR